MTTSEPVKVELSRLRQTSWQTYALRFAFGGLATVLTGLIAHAYGPVIGGLFLAFPAILPATVTLIEKHSGKAEAERDTRGAVIGALGLFVFGGLVWLLAGSLPAWLVLLLAMLLWLAVSIGTWLALRWATEEKGKRPGARG